MSTRKVIELSNICNIKDIMSIEQLSEIDKTMEVIIDNLHNFVFHEGVYDENNIIKTEIEWKIENPSRVSKVVVDFSNQYDEFYIYQDSKCIAYVEVVKKDIAISNDMDFLDSDEKKNYKLGNEYSYYTQLGDTEYYYREL